MYPNYDLLTLTKIMADDKNKVVQDIPILDTSDDNLNNH